MREGVERDSAWLLTTLRNSWMPERKRGISPTTEVEVNDLIPNDVRSPEDLDDVLATIGTLGIEVLEHQPKLPSSVLKRTLEEEVEPGGGLGLDLLPSAVEQTDDPIRIYLREMGVVPLLTREGEVDIVKRIERGQVRVLKALSRQHGSQSVYHYGAHSSDKLPLLLIRCRRPIDG